MIISPPDSAAPFAHASPDLGPLGCVSSHQRARGARESPEPRAQSVSRAPRVPPRAAALPRSADAARVPGASRGLPVPQLSPVESPARRAHVRTRVCMQVSACIFATRATKDQTKSPAGGSQLRGFSGQLWSCLQSTLNPYPPPAGADAFMMLLSLCCICTRGAVAARRRQGRRSPTPAPCGRLEAAYVTCARTQRRASARRVNVQPAAAVGAGGSARRRRRTRPPRVVLLRGPGAIRRASRRDGRRDEQRRALAKLSRISKRRGQWVWVEHSMDRHSSARISASSRGRLRRSTPVD